MLVKPFWSTYGVSADDEGLYRLVVASEQLNWYGAAYGGCYITVGTAACQSLAPKNTFVSNMAMSFLRSASLDDELIARPNLVKAGRTLTSIDVDVSTKGKLTNQLTCAFSPIVDDWNLDYCKRGTFETLKRPETDLYLNRKDDPSLPSDEGDSFLTMFCGHHSWRNKGVEDLEGRATIGVYTSELFANGEGLVDPAIVGFLVDDAGGVSSWSLYNQTPTSFLTYNLFCPVWAGADLACETWVEATYGRRVYVAGRIWADEMPVGTCSATFFRVKA